MIAWRIAMRELRGGLSGFWIFLLCLALGVGGIAAVGSVRSTFQDALSRESATLLGGDANLEFTYRFATAEERAWMDEYGTQTSEIVDFRSMIGAGNDRALVQVKGVDDAYPLYGSVDLTSDIAFSDAIAIRDGLPGIVVAPALIDRLQIKVGDILRLGTKDFELRGIIEREPDNATAGFSFGPRVIVRLDALQDSGLLATGTLFNSHYRVLFPPEVNVAHMKTLANREMEDSGMRWQDRREGARGLSRFIDRMGAFLVIVGIAGLAVGGIGVSAAVRSYLDKKRETIATLKTLGATSATIFGTYLIQIGLLAALGIAIGMAIGAIIPIAIGPAFADQLPIPVSFTIHPMPLLEAAIYGTLTALIFTIWPLAKAIDIRAAGLFRNVFDSQKSRPRWYFIAIVVGLTATLVGLATWFSGTERLALWSAAGVIGSLITLHFAAIGIRTLSKRLAKSRLTRGRPALRMALGAVGGPGGEASAVILSLGLGLTVLATIGQIDTNMRRAVAEEIPDIAPAFFFVDIQNAQLEGFLDLVNADPGVTNIDTAPMLRGIITQVNGQNAREALGNHWVLRGDRGVTYAASPPENGEITAGEWWPADYTGPNLMSFSAEEGEELGLKLGDELTVNILGRDLTATITNFRTVDFENMEINFVMALNPAALAGAPHSHIATVYGGREIEGRLVRALAQDYPNITAISVRDAIDRVSELLNGVGAATRWGAFATLLTGFVVLIGAAAAGERTRVYEAALLKTLGAARARILTSFALRSAILGATAGSVAVFAAALSAWAIMTFVMEVDFIFNLPSAILIITGGALASLVAGLLFALRPLSARPAQVLRARE